jgi:L-ascorbate metabolism protein UlaG (beta-lactamase superfamily)
VRVIFSKTGSDGNCTAIESDSGEILIVDCGIAVKQINRQVGYRALSASGVLLSHVHFDHTAAHRDFSSASVTLYAPDTESLTGDSTAFQKRYYKMVEHGKTIALRGRVSGKTEFLAVPFRLIHCNAQDGSDCPCVGYLISEPSKDGDKLLIATDTAFIGMEVKDAVEPTFQGHRFLPCSIYMLESNYVRLEDSFETLKGTQLEVEKRRVSSHMSAQTASSFISKQNLSKCREIYLIHISHSATESDIIEMVRMFREAIENNATATQERKKEIKIYANGKVY